MAYIKKDPLEVSKARSLAAKARKNCRGGRPRGSTKDPSELAEPVTSIAIMECDREVLRRYAYQQNTSLKGAFHLLMEKIAPQLKTV